MRTSQGRNPAIKGQIKHIETAVSLFPVVFIFIKLHGFHFKILCVADSIKGAKVPKMDITERPKG